MHALGGMYTQLTRMFNIKGCLRFWWHTTNGILQGCPLSVTLINALTTTWKCIIDDIQQMVTIGTNGLPPEPMEPKLPPCLWVQKGEGVEQMWMWKCVTPRRCVEIGWPVGGECCLPPNLDHGGDPDAPTRPKPKKAAEQTPMAVVWSRLGLEEMPSPTSTETSRPAKTLDSGGGDDVSHEPSSPRRPRVLLDDSADDHLWDEEADLKIDTEMAPGAHIELSGGYANGAYLLALCRVSFTLMLMATRKCIRLIEQEINIKKLMIFEVQHKARGRTCDPKAELNGQRLPVQ